MNYQELLSSESENPVLLVQAPALGPGLTVFAFLCSRAALSILAGF